MKNLIITLTLSLLLFSCSGKQEIVQNTENKSEIVTENTGSLSVPVKVEKEGLNQAKTIKIDSPVYTLTGEVLSGTTKIEITWKNSDKTDSYELKKFKVGDKEFLSNLRLDYGNIAKGTNEYQVNFIKADGSKEVRKYVFDAEYDEINFSKNIEVFKKLQDYQKEKEFIGKTSCTFMAKDEYLLYVYGKYIQSDCFEYYKENDSIVYLITKKINDKSIEGKVKNLDGIVNIYYNNDKIVSDFIINERDGYNIPKYDVKENAIISNDGWGDVCGGYNNYYKYSIEEKKQIKGVYESSDGCYSMSKFIKSYNGNNSDGNGNYFRIFTLGTGSILDISFGNGKLNESISGNMGIGFLLPKPYEDKEFLNGSHIVKSSFDGFPLVYKNTNYDIPGKFLENNKSNVFDFLRLVGDNDFISIYAILDKDTKISITGCQKDNNKEYGEESFLDYGEYKLFERNGDEFIANYSYNISPKLGNVCTDLPYKVKVYFKDGTTKEGLYYLVLDPDKDIPRILNIN